MTARELAHGTLGMTARKLAHETLGMTALRVGRPNVREDWA